MRPTRLRLAIAIVLIMSTAPATFPAHASPASPAAETQGPSPVIPFASLSGDLDDIREDLDEATANALKTENAIEQLKAEMVALDERIAVTTARIEEQRLLVEESQASLEDARTRFENRVVQAYKGGSVDPWMLIFSSDDLAELMSRALFITRLAESDGRIVADLNRALADALYQQTELDNLMLQDTALRTEQERQRASLEHTLKQQEAAVARLTEEARSALLEARRLNAQTRKQWRAASIPLGTVIPRATATVSPHPEPYVISAYMPRTYESTGQSWTAVCSWYGPGFNGRGTASGQIFNQDDFTCASRTLPFGTVLALSRGSKRIIVYVNDRGPYIAGRDLDLSKAAAKALGVSGVASVHAEIVVPVY